MKNNALVTPVLILLFLEYSSGLPITGPCGASSGDALAQIRQACQAVLANHAHELEHETLMLEDAPTPISEPTEVSHPSLNMFDAFSEGQSFTSVLHKIEGELSHMNNLAVEVIDPLLSFASQLGEWFAPAMTSSTHRVEDARTQNQVTALDLSISVEAKTPPSPLPTFIPAPASAAGALPTVGPTLSAGFDAAPAMHAATTAAATLAASIVVIALLIGMKGFLVHLYRKTLGDGAIFLGQTKSQNVPGRKSNPLKGATSEKLLESSDEKGDIESLLDGPPAPLNEKYPILDADHFEEDSLTKSELYNYAATFVPFHPLEVLRGTDAPKHDDNPPACEPPSPDGSSLGVASSAAVRAARRQALALPVTPIRAWMFQIMFIMLGWSTLFINPRLASGSMRSFARRPAH